MHTRLKTQDIENALQRGSLRDFPTEVLHNQVVALSGAEVNSLIASCDVLLGNQEYGMVDRNRIGVVKLLVSLLPTAYPSVRKWMFREGDLYYFEVQFTFCCFLSDILSFTPPDSESANAVLNLATEYLHRVPSDEAYNAFMAADMLGDHWVGDAGIGALVEVARHSRNPVGKKAALGALPDALRKGKVSPRYLPSVRELIEKKGDNAEDRENHIDV